jgi:prevent-host-death family protein
MKVKVNELKTHLSRYLRELEKEESIEVCMREEPVAYLVSARKQKAGAVEDIRARVDATGLVYHEGRLSACESQLAPPAKAGDGRTDIDSTKQMREGRDW